LPISISIVPAGLALCRTRSCEQALAGEEVSVEETADGAWMVRFYANSDRRHRPAAHEIAPPQRLRLASNRRWEPQRHDRVVPG
jgi:hypothetical protein